MTQLRGQYLQGRFRWEPGPTPFEYVGEAETYDFLASSHRQQAYFSAKCLDLKWSEDARDWLRRVSDEDLQVAIEQSCHEGRLLDRDQRALRMQRFPPQTQAQCEVAIRDLPDESGVAALTFIYWWVRIDRAQRTGNPGLDPARSLDFPF